MAALDLTSFEAALKVHYTDLRVKNLVYRNNPFLAAVPKYEFFGGKNLPIPVQYGVPQGRSATFADANANQTPGNYTDYVLTRVRNYAIASIGNETLEASVGNANAFMEAASSEIDGALRSLTQDLAGNLYRDQLGVRGNISAAGYAGTTLTLANPANVTEFELDMQIVTNPNADGSGLMSGPQPITAINRDTGEITLAVAIGGAGDFLFQLGDTSATPAPAGPKKAAGLAAWLPEVAPVAGDPAFFGVLRERDSSRLAGQRYDGTAETIEEAMIGAGSLLFREGGRPDVCFMNPLSYSELIKSLGSKVVYDLMRSSDVADVFFEAVRIHLPSGSAMVVADPNCPSGRAYMLQMDTWKMYSLGMAPKILMTDGLRFLRENNADAVEVRAGYYAQLGCTAPGWNATIALAT
jgi:hypothetical protein